MRAAERQVVLGMRTYKTINTEKYDLRLFFAAGAPATRGRTGQHPAGARASHATHPGVVYLHLPVGARSSIACAWPRHCSESTLPPPASSAFLPHKRTERVILIVSGPGQDKLLCMRLTNSLAFLVCN
jgi:hypothetical protein